MELIIMVVKTEGDTMGAIILKVKELTGSRKLAASTPWIWSSIMPLAIKGKELSENISKEP